MIATNKKQWMGLAAGLLMGASQLTAAAEPVKIALIEPMSGFLASNGEGALNTFNFVADRMNGKSDIQYEIISLDNKLDPKFALVQLQKAIDDGVRYIAQGNSSAIAHALLGAIDKHNARNPGEEVLFLNYAAVDPALTNDRCSYWHFRFDAHVDIKMTAIVDAMKQQNSAKKVYLINQDYSFGRSVADAAKRMLAIQMPNVEIVGEDYHPIARVKDFAPYIAKIKASGADTVITGNWGNDYRFLAKAGADAGLNVDWVTFYGGGQDAVSGVGSGGAGHVKQITEWHSNLPNAEMEAVYRDYKKLHPDTDWYYHRVYVMFGMLDKAIKQAGSSDPVKVAAQLEGMRYKGPLGADVWMRANDHQIFQDMYVSTLQKGTKYTIDNTDMGFVTDYRIPAADTVLSTTCKMKRP